MKTFLLGILIGWFLNIVGQEIVNFHTTYKWEMCEERTHDASKCWHDFDLSFYESVILWTPRLWERWEKAKYNDLP